MLWKCGKVQLYWMLPILGYIDGHWSEGVKPKQSLGRGQTNGGHISGIHLKLEMRNHDIPSVAQPLQHYSQHFVDDIVLALCIAI